MQIRFKTLRDRYLRFEKQIEPPAEGTIWSTRTASSSLNNAQGIGAPGDNEAGVAQFAFAQKNSASGRVHTSKPGTRQDLQD